MVRISPAILRVLLSHVQAGLLLQNFRHRSSCDTHVAKVQYCRRKPFIHLRAQTIRGQHAVTDYRATSTSRPVPATLISALLSFSFRGAGGVMSTGNRAAILGRASSVHFSFVPSHYTVQQNNNNNNNNNIYLTAIGFSPGGSRF